MADGQHLLCSVFLQRLRWSAYCRVDAGSSGFTDADANSYCNSYLHPNSYSYSYSNSYSDGYNDASAESYTNYDCERNTDFYSTT